ncbi:MAG: hypothetical protein ACRENI_11605 [Gemmatimonadaceae bacterium]
MTDPLATAHIALSAIFLLWNILLAGRITRLSASPRLFGALTAVAGLLILPAMVAGVATANTLYGRAIQTIAWVWPATLVVFAAQSTVAMTRGLVSPLLGLPITAYNVLLAIAAIARYAMAHGVEPPRFALTLVAAQAAALSLVLGPAALVSPAALHVPVLAPAFRSRWRTSAVVRAGIAVAAAAWAGVIVAGIPPAGAALGSYASYADTRLQERPSGDFSIGVKIFPHLTSGPVPLAIRNDLALADSIDAEVLSITISPDGATRTALDSLRRTLAERRRGGATLIVALGYSAGPGHRFGRPRPLDADRRLELAGLIAQRLTPDYLIPAVEPYGAGAVAHGVLAVERWRDYFARAATIVHDVDPQIGVALSASSYGPRDSALFAWAASPDSPMDAVGFAFAPSAQGAPALDSQMEAAARWLDIVPAGKERWVFSAEALPMAHGERSQARALRRVVAWATTKPGVRGVIVSSAGDYGRMTGLRAANGRLRRAALAVGEASRALEERSTTQADSAAAAGVVVRP